MSMVKKIFIFLGILWLVSVVGTYIDLYYKDVEEPLRKSIGVSTMFIFYVASAVIGAYYQTRENKG